MTAPNVSHGVGKEFKKSDFFSTSVTRIEKQNTIKIYMYLYKEKEKGKITIRDMRKLEK